MRRQFATTTEDLMGNDPRLVLLLGDIGVFGFRNVFKRFPERTYNVGICEQAMTSLAAGLAKEGMIPILHSIAPFLVERSYEQLKIDFGYQRLSACIVSVGASYDYAALGCTHHCPGDIAVLLAIPDMQIVVPGTPAEFDVLLRTAYAHEHATYFRLSERSHCESIEVQFGQAVVVRQGNLGTVIAVGPTLSAVLQATQGLDVNILYYSTVAPFDTRTLKEHCSSNVVAVVEPFYEGTLANDIVSALNGRAVRLLSIGVPRRFLTEYGLASDHDEQCGLVPIRLEHRLISFFHEQA